MTTTRSIIVDSLSTTLTTEYTNSSNGNAIIKSINVNGSAANGANTLYTVGSSAQTWSWFGSSSTPYNTLGGMTSEGFGVPYPIQLSSNRVLLIWQPNFMHIGGTLDYLGGTVLHTQIVEFQTDKFVCGPIVNISLPAAYFNSSTYSLFSGVTGITGSYGGTLIKGVAVTSTKVIFGLRVSTNFHLFKMTISGNKVDSSSLQNLSLTGATYFNTTTAGDFAIAKVPSNTSQVVVGGYANNYWSLQAFNVPDSGAITNCSSLSNTGIAVSNYHFALAPLCKEATANAQVYILAATTSATAGIVQNWSYNSNTQTFAAVGSTSAITATTAWAGLTAVTLSTGTGNNAVLASTSTGITANVQFYRQTSNTAASNAVSNVAMQSSVARTIYEGFNWGDERAVFTLDAGLVTFDSLGVANTIHTTNDTTSTTRYIQQWFPFNDRPLYNRYATTSPIANWVPQWISRTNTSNTTNIGVANTTFNYFPWGHDYGNHYQWSDKADCWIVGQFGKLYALAANGTPIGEISQFNFNASGTPTLNYLYNIRQVAVNDSGIIHTIHEYGNGVDPSYNMNDQWSSLVNTMYAVSLQPVIRPERLANTVPLTTPTDMAGFLSCSLTAFTDYNGQERAYLLYNSVIATPDTYIATWYGANSSANAAWTASQYNTAVASTTAGSWNVGFNPNLRLVQDSPVSFLSQEGLWRIYGSQGTNSLANYGYTGFSDRYTRASFASFNSASYSLTTTTNPGYGIPYKRSSRTNVWAWYDPTSGTTTPRVWSSVGGQINDMYGWFDRVNYANTFYQYVNIATTKFGYGVTFQQTEPAVNATPRIFAFKNRDFNPTATLSSNTNEYGAVITIPTSRTSWSVLASNVSTEYAVNGDPDTSKVTVAIANSSGNTFYITLDQEVNANSLYRASDTYVIAPNMTLKMRSNTPKALTGLITVIEEV